MSRIFGEKRSKPQNVLASHSKIKISLFQHYCVAYTVNKLLKCIWEKNYNYEGKYATKMLNPPLIYSNQCKIG